MDARPTATLVRAARELLRWNQKTLAQNAAVGVATVRRFETGVGVQPESVEAIVKALQKAGIAFLGPDHRDVEVKEGVALKANKTRPKTRARPSTATEAAEQSKTNKAAKPARRTTPST